MSDWIRLAEHETAIHRRDRTIHSLQAQLKQVAGISRLVPAQYAAELVAAYELAFGQSPNGDMGPNGKPGSRSPVQNPQAVRVIKAELAMLERRAVRNPATSAGEGALAKAVDGLEPRR